MKSLVQAHLERIPGDVFVRFQREIKELVSKEHGVYALYHKDHLYYVGLAINLKSRIQQHLKDQHAGRWNRFSLYLVRDVDHLKELETLILHIAAPKGNVQSGRFGGSNNLKPQLKKLLVESVSEIMSGSGKKKAKGTTGRRKKGTGARETLSAYLRPGTLLRAGYKGQHLKAEVQPDGTLLLNGKSYRSLSVAAMSIVPHPTNGWRFWKVQNTAGGWVFADTLRKKV